VALRTRTPENADGTRQAIGGGQSRQALGREPRRSNRMYKNLSVAALGVSGRQSEIIELALSHGFKAVDVDLVEFAEQVKTHGIARARRLLDSAKLKVSACALPIPVDGDPERQKQDLDDLAGWAELAAQIGCTRMTTSIEPAGDTRPYHENFEFYRRRLGEIGDRLAGFGIRLGIELQAAGSLRQARAFQFIHTYDQMVLLARTVGVPNVGLSLDLWNWHLGGGTLDQLQTAGAERLVSVYVSDIEPGTVADSAAESSRRLPGETGMIDSAAVLSLLNQLRYDGPVTPRAAPTPGLSRDRLVKQAAEALDRTWKAAQIGATQSRVQ
jgi:sugar phosphate isomerase/epimerase